MNIVIDIGNTRIKYALFNGSDLKETGCGMVGLFPRLQELKNEGERLDIFLSGSGCPEEDLKERLALLADTCLEASPCMVLPIKIGYATPETLGFDRIANCVGAMTLFPACPLLVIDSGTAITFNYVNNSTFLGGNISPGLEMRFRALHQFTARLPYVEAQKEFGEVGQTTETAIRNGVVKGMLFEVQGYIAAFAHSVAGKGRVVITGGNGRFFENRLNPDVCFCDDLGFIGLNRILENTKKDKTI